ncbi:hypothetical protein BJY04DRAFT_170313 [Aspergillus karnatakaensis]|uniref:uncharacterized protein n=1 Tax=Aspergillus karnatakaensis TaxID=1810916 RepID=UPI003CCD8FEE
MNSLILLTLISISLALPVSLSSPLEQQPLLELSPPDLQPVTALKISHGTFVNANITNAHTPTEDYTQTLHASQTPYNLLDRYSDELFALCLLLLVPITLGIVELADRLLRYLSVEEFPDRGRDQRRLESLEEREEWVLRRKEREVRVEKSRSWWRCARR